jgi:hypothetical protein
MSLFVERMVSELNRILNGEKQRQIAPASHILTVGGGSWRKMMIFRFPSLLRKDRGLVGGENKLKNVIKSFFFIIKTLNLKNSCKDIQK